MIFKVKTFSALVPWSTEKEEELSKFVEEADIIKIRWYQSSAGSGNTRYIEHMLTCVVSYGKEES